MQQATGVEELSQEHTLLDQSITKEIERPDPNFMKISELKRQKLRIKDEIAHLTH